MNVEERKTAYAYATSTLMMIRGLLTFLSALIFLKEASSLGVRLTPKDLCSGLFIYVLIHSKTGLGYSLSVFYPTHSLIQSLSHHSMNDFQVEQSSKLFQASFYLTPHRVRNCRSFCLLPLLPWKPPLSVFQSFWHLPCIPGQCLLYSLATVRNS